MIYISDLQQLASKWLVRADSPSQPDSYKIALNECIYDLNNAINRAIEEDALEQEAFIEMCNNADLYGIRQS